jgi:hypothetical protein
MMSALQSKETITKSSPVEVFERMVSAQNRHDLEGMVANFSLDFQSEQPFHPERNFVGLAGVRKNWGFFFSTVPDIQVDILSSVFEGDTVWCELHMHGTRVDGMRHSIRGVTIQRIQDGLIVWSRLYIETPSEPSQGETA